MFVTWKQIRLEHADLPSSIQSWRGGRLLGDEQGAPLGEDNAPTTAIRAGLDHVPRIENTSCHFVKVLLPAYIDMFSLC